jgi:hypothetical protein
MTMSMLAPFLNLADPNEDFWPSTMTDQRGGRAGRQQAMFMPKLDV